MSLKKLAGDTVAALDEALDDLSQEQKEKILQIVEQSLVKSASEITTAHHEATKKCCGPEEDMAHQIRKEVTKAYELLTFNLSAMR